MKKYRLVREAYDGAQTTVSQSDNIHYLNKRMETAWMKELQEAKAKDRNIQRSFFVDDSARITGVALWMILENTQE